MLTHQACQKAKPKEREYSLTDDSGLVLRVYPGGTKTFQYRYALDGKRKRLNIGRFPTVSLADARTRVKEAQLAVDSGIDPTEAVPTEQTFEFFYRNWYEINHEAWSAGYKRRVASRVEEDLLPGLGHRPIAKITGQDVLGEIRKIEARGALDMSRRVLSYATSIFAVAVIEGAIENDPTQHLIKALKPKPKTKHQPRLRAHELPEFFNHLNDYEGEPQTVVGLKMIMHTFVRTGELLQMHEREIEGDVWRIPGDRMKMGLEHLVPLTQQVLEYIEQAMSIPHKRRRQGYIFDMSGNTMIFAMYRMGYRTKATVHGFRGTASTILNEKGRFRSDVIERQLAHVESNAVRRAYNAAEYMDERRALMQWWSDYLNEREFGFVPQRVVPESDPLDDLLGVPEKQDEGLDDVLRSLLG